MLDLTRLHAQLSDFSAYQQTEQRQRAERLRHALEAFASCGTDWEQLRETVREAQKVQSWLMADLREDPTGCHACADRPSPLTVVATDGSQIYPDRHVEPHCYLLNISRIAFQYGTGERPLMEAVPDFRFQRDAYLDEFFDDLERDLSGKATTEVVSALRDEQELAALLETAVEARMEGRPLVAVADGTLIRWMIRKMQNRELEEQLIGRYADLLRRFQEEQIPLCSYISMPGNTEVVNVLRVHREEHRRVVEPPLEGFMDRWVFEHVLEAGERSAVFESSSHIQRQYGSGDRICYFYIHVESDAGSEIGRVEVPAWVADRPDLLDLIHATVLSECRKGGGYPMILSEAHERAVIRAKEKAVFYELIERSMRRHGLTYTSSNKAASKRRPLV